MTVLFSWLHLSDIHAGHGRVDYRHDQKAVINRLLEHVGQQVSDRRIALDAILVTGDIAFSGKIEQYAHAEKWLLSVAEATGVVRESIFLVPGNHDVDRDADRDDHTSNLVSSLRSGERQISDALARETNIALLTSRISSYLSFAGKFASVEKSAQPLSWKRELVGKNGLRIRLFGLNTALLCADERDKGRLQVGMSWKSEATDPHPNGITMVMSHHPFLGGWLHDGDEADAWLKSTTQVHLMGHVHTSEHYSTNPGHGGHFVRLLSGALHSDPQEPPEHTYNFAEIVINGQRDLAVRVYPFRWDDKTKKFASDASKRGFRATRCAGEGCGGLI